MVILLARADAQDHVRVIVVGAVTDSATGLPLDNALVFLANTPYGSSTSINGTFVLSNIQPGEYDLVTSRLGYIPQKRHLNLGHGDSLSIQVFLEPRAIPMSGTEVIEERSRSSLPSLNLLVPESRKEMYCIYGAETTLPIGILTTDSCLYMYSFDPVLIDSERFLRLWLLIFNTSDSPIEFDALHSVSLSAQRSKVVYHNILPQMLESSRSDVQDSTVRRMISQSMGQVFQVLGHQRWTYVRNADRFDLEAGRRPWLGSNAPSEIVGGINPERLWDIYSGSSSAGTLKHYRIFPSNGVHGYIYFPFPGLEWQSASKGFPEAFTYQYSLDILTPVGQRQIVFKAH
jgi:hypothetical protein